MPPTFNPKIILITGCSSGFGLVMAARLARKGHRVVATMRDLAKTDSLRRELKKYDVQADILRLDVTDKDSIRAAVSQVIQTHVRIDVLINNAGYGIGGFFEDLSDDEIRAQFEVNFFGVQNVTREVLPHMRERRQGKIINISSVSGFSTSPCFSAYNASKWALESFSESLWYEARLFGIQVCLIEPGSYKTKIFYENARYARGYDNPDSPYYDLSQYLRNKVMTFVDKCHKNPEEVAALAEKLILQQNPPLRNIPDAGSQCLYALRKLLPFKAYSWLIRTALFAGYKPDQGVKPMRSCRNSSRL